MGRTKVVAFYPVLKSIPILPMGQNNIDTIFGYRAEDFHSNETRLFFNLSRAMTEALLKLFTEFFFNWYPIGYNIFHGYLFPESVTSNLQPGQCP